MMDGSVLTLGSAEVATLVGACIVGPLSAVVVIMRTQQSRLDKQAAARESQLEQVQRERESQFTRMLAEREETAKQRGLAIDRAMTLFENSDRAAQESLRVLAGHIANLQAGQQRTLELLQAHTGQLELVSASLRETVRELRLMHDNARRV